MAAGFLWQPKHFAVADDVAVAADVNAAAAVVVKELNVEKGYIQEDSMLPLVSCDRRVGVDT